MNCRSFRKFVGAFADGELDTQANAEALEHLNMCPQCVARVADVQHLKQAIIRTVGQETAPEHLRASVRASIGRQVGPVKGAAGSPASRWVYRLLVPMGMAAAIVLAITAWEWTRSADTRLAPGVKTVREAQLATEVRNQHRMCTVHALEHHDATLGRDLAGIAERLTDRLKLRAMAPDLGGHGYALVGADQCGVRGRTGGHVLYRAADGAMLSVFSMAQDNCTKVTFGRTVRSAGMDFAVDQRDDLAVVAWSDGCVGYVFCGQAPMDQVLEMSADARRAFQGRE
ncbi:MAG: anti-sigma factor family protein [Phycisphaerae bacterium]